MTVDKLYIIGYNEYIEAHMVYMCAFCVKWRKHDSENK